MRKVLGLEGPGDFTLKKTLTREEDNCVEWSGLFFRSLEVKEAEWRPVTKRNEGGTEQQEDR